MLRALGALAAGVFAGALAGCGRGDAYPSRPIKFVVPFAAGGGTDAIARWQAEGLTADLKTPVVVENKAGAGGVVGAEAVARSDPDGYTVLLGTSAHVINRLLDPKVCCDVPATFAPVSLSWVGGAVLVVPAASPFHSVDDLVAALRAKPGAMNYASGGVGTAAHLAAAAFTRVLGLDAVHVPYKGSGDIVPALLAGNVQFAFPIAAAGIPASRDGRVRALAVTTRERLPQLPEVPTLRERYREELLVQEAWGGLWLPKGTPDRVVDTLFAAHRKVMAGPALRGRYHDNGVEVVVSSSPASFAAFIADETLRWSRVLAATGLDKSTPASR